MHNTAGLQGKGRCTDLDSSTENRQLRLRIFKGAAKKSSPEHLKKCSCYGESRLTTMRTQQCTG